MLCYIFCVLKYLHVIEVRPKQQFSLNYSQMEVGYGVSSKKIFFSAIEKTHSILLTNQMSPLPDRYQSFFLHLTNQLHHSTQKILHLSSESSSFQLFSFLKVCFVDFYIPFCAISEDNDG